MQSGGARGLELRTAVLVELLLLMDFKKTINQYLLQRYDQVNVNRKDK